jgi:hypothetical protein
MSVPCKNSLTNRELNIIYQKISDKFVDELCKDIIDGKTVSGNFSQLIQDKMIELLGKAETQNKMADAVLQSVGATLRHSTKGPYLLYVLLDNAASLREVEGVMRKVCNDIYKEGDNKYDFVKRLAKVLNEPHPGLFITQKSGGARTHKRRKTDKKVRKSRSVRGGNKQWGGESFGKGSDYDPRSPQEMQADAAAWEIKEREAEKAEEAKKKAQLAAEAKHNARITTKLGKMMGNVSGSVKSGLSNAGKAVSGSVKSGLSNAGKAVIGNVKSGVSTIGQAAQKTYRGSMENVSRAAGAVRNAPKAISNLVTGTPVNNADSGLIANELYADYEKTLLNNATKNINGVSNQITTKMVNASYIYMLKNGQTVLDAVRSNIETSLSNQSTSYDVNRIIIIQALFSAIRELTHSIHTVAKKQAKISPGFNPTSPAFISDVVHELLQNIRFVLKIE